MKYTRWPFLFMLFCLSACASQGSTLLTGRTVAGEPICLDNRDSIPAVVRKFFNTRDLTTEEGKIDYLIDRIRNSHLRFIRNRIEYDSDSAGKFIRWKLDRLRSKGSKIETAQDFVSVVTSGSRMSGQPYTIILQGGNRYHLQLILQNELDALEYCLKQYPTEPQAISQSAPSTTSTASANTTLSEPDNKTSQTNP